MLVDEMMDLLNKIDDVELVKYIIKMIDESNISNYRGIEEIIELGKVLKECKYNKTAYDIACNIVILESETTEEQIDLMKEKFKQCQSCERSMDDFDGELDKITSLEEKDVKKRILVPVYDDKKKNEDSKED